MTKAKSRRKARPSQVKMTPEMFKDFEQFQKPQGHFRQQKLLQTMRDTRANADALEGYLARMDPAFRSAMPDVQEWLRRLIDQTFQSRGVSGKDALDAFPSSYQHLREVVKGQRERCRR
jgi:hypothetical protein